MLKTGLIGTGYGAEVFAPAFRNNQFYKLTSVFSGDSKRAKSIRKSLGFKRSYDNWAQLIEDSDLDIVCIATPVYTHYEIAKYALENNKHLILAAPFTLQVNEALELADLAAQKGLLGVVAHHLNFFPARKYITHLIKNGKIGVPTHVHRLYRTASKLMHKTTQSWKFNKKLGGGTLNIIGSHDIDFLLRVIGGIHKVNAFTELMYAERQNQNDELFQCSADDAFRMNIEFHNGAKAALSASSVYPGKEANEFLFYGTEGLLTLRDDNEILFYTREGNKERIAIPPNYQTTSLPGQKEISPFYMLLESVASAIHKGTEVTPTFDEAVHVQRAIHTAHYSADTYNWIEIGSEELENPGNASTQSSSNRQIDKIYR